MYGKLCTTGAINDFGPRLGALINFFWGSKLDERWSSRIAIFASGLTFVIALLLFAFLNSTHGQPAVVDPPFLDGWIRIGESVEIPWQMRVDTLSVTMMLFVSFVGTLIHIYAAGYMHGDPRFSRFFAYINMFLAFMFILVTGNNFLMMFVGWEGVGVCSFLLIGFWFDKTRGVGWRNSNAAKKAMIANRIGDFGMLLGIFLIFWTFGTLDYFRPGEIANVHFLEEAVHEYEAEHSGEAAAGDHGEAADDDHSEEAAPADDEHGQLLLMSFTAQDHEEEGAEDDHGEAAAEDDHGEADAHGAEEEHGASAFPPEFLNNEHIPTEQLGVFGQAERMIEEGAQVNFGSFSMPIETVLVLITLSCCWARRVNRRKFRCSSGCQTRWLARPR